MAYCVTEDLLLQINEQTLIELSDDAVPPTAVQEEVVARAIADADGTVNAYCEGRYAVPFTPVPPKIQGVSVDIAIYNLYARRGDACPDTRKDRWKEAIRFLERVADGKIRLGATPPGQTNTAGSAAVYANDRLFSRDTMKGF